MRKIVLYSIPFFFINVMLLLSCSENANDVLTTPQTSSATTYVEENASLDYAELGKLPEAYTKVMDKEEKEAWEKLSTKYRIKKNALSSKFYQEHKAEIIERIKFLYQYAVDKNLPPSSLSFIWADREENMNSKFRLLSYSDSTGGIDPPDAGADSSCVEEPKHKVAYGTVSRNVYHNTFYTQSMDIYADYSVYRENGKIFFEQDSDYYTLFPINAQFQGTSFISITSAGLAECFVAGFYMLDFLKTHVQLVDNFDLLDDYNKKKQ